MTTKLNTERLILREILATDRDDLYEMDSDHQVPKFIFNQPVQSMEEIDNAIKYIQNQYIENGIGRWAVVSLDTNEMIGWCGLKLLTEPVNGRVNVYDLGYRFKQRHWGNGYASEACNAIIDYAKNKLKLDSLIATVHPENTGSKNVLKKLGFNFGEQFDYDGSPAIWCELNLESK